MNAKHLTKLADGPMSMLRGALLYGGLTYVLSGVSTKRPLYFEDKAIDF
jgi:hypothetical protein